MKEFFTPIWEFIKANKGRFIWELVAVGMGIGVAWLISSLTGQDDLKACQDERATLLQQKASAQSFADSVKWHTVINAQKTQIKSLENENNKLKEQAALDSAARLNELEAMRAINSRYKR